MQKSKCKMQRVERSILWISAYARMTEKAGWTAEASVLWTLRSVFSLVLSV